MKKSNLSCQSIDAQAYIERQKQTLLFTQLPAEEQAKVILDVLSAYFSVSYTNVSPALLDVIRTHLLTNYAQLNVYDFTTAFNRKLIEKKQGVAMSVGEFVQPIQDYFKEMNLIKGKLQAERDREIREENERQRSLMEYQKEQREMLELFHDLKRQGVKKWTGTSSQAAMISKTVSEGVVSNDEKREIYRQVVEEMNKKQALIDPRNNPYSEMMQDMNLANYEVKWKCAEIVVNKCLEI